MEMVCSVSLFCYPIQRKEKATIHQGPVKQVEKILCEKDTEWRWQGLLFPLDRWGNQTFEIFNELPNLLWRLLNGVQASLISWSIFFPVSHMAPLGTGQLFSCAILDLCFDNGLNHPSTTHVKMRMTCIWHHPGKVAVGKALKPPLSASAAFLVLPCPWQGRLWNSGTAVVSGFRGPGRSWSCGVGR